MKRLLRRFSFWLLIGFILAGIWGPSLFDMNAETQVASPFSKPLWIGKDSPPAMTFTLTPKTRAAQFQWVYPAPPNIAIWGTVELNKPSSASLVWETPDGDRIEIARNEDLPSFNVDIDGRDMSFKTSLGLSPFDNPMEKLFPSKGKYTLRMSPDDLDIRSGAIHVRIEGARWGLLGTDQRGRDVFHLFLLGIRVSLLVGICATILATLLGVSVGLVAGYAGGMVDTILMRLVDILLAIPGLPILMVLAGIWGKGLWQLIVILSIFSWMGTARTIRSLTLSLRENAFVEGLRALGARPSYIMYRHLLPESLPILLANIALGVPSAILAEAGLSFLGLSDPRIISWGRMLNEAHGFGAFTTGAWWLILPPGVGISLICLVFLDLGRTLEEMADPRLRGGGKR
ncbi:ABC transporter permease [Thermovirga lienii]|uniref:ABC transporter permease n=1 Tax=Thermovirga lienii TaxID=336261 RepID=UPI002FE0571E